ncbi:MAG: radical SAM protein [Anaerolineae bacterium]|nr:radical SAM protein [Anaerolineae bacterium]
MIRVSIGTASVLGLCRIPMAAAPTTAYLMVGGRCVMNCAFCAQGRESQSSNGSLSRISWPEFPLDKVCIQLRKAERQGKLDRCCIQVTAERDSYQQAIRVVKEIRRTTPLPLSIALLPADISQVAELIESGVDRVGIGLDAASERLFRECKGPHWDHMLSIIEKAAERFPGLASVHLIVGLGESEREMLARMLWVHDLGHGIGLFAFTPVRGTALAERPQPALAQYRRVQAARWLITQHGARLAHCAFNGRGALTGIDLVGWRDALANGEAFRTVGCPGCNRPFYNERPGGTMYNYPRALTAVEARQCIQEMGLESADACLLP